MSDRNVNGIDSGIWLGDPYMSQKKKEKKI